jgi:hypothetical protein
MNSRVVPPTPSFAQEREKEKERREMKHGRVILPHYTRDELDVH